MEERNPFVCDKLTPKLVQPVRNDRFGGSSRIFASSQLLFPRGFFFSPRFWFLSLYATPLVAYKTRDCSPRFRSRAKTRPREPAPETQRWKPPGTAETFFFFYSRKLFASLRIKVSLCFFFEFDSLNSNFSRGKRARFFFFFSLINAHLSGHKRAQKNLPITE